MVRRSNGPSKSSRRAAQAPESGSEEDQRRERKPKIKQSATQQRQRDNDEEMQDAQNDDEEQQAEDDEDDGPAFDPATFRDQPLDPATAAQKLKTFSNDWATLEGRIGKTTELLREVAVDYEDAFRAEQTNPLGGKLEEAMRTLIDDKMEIGIHKKVLADLQNQVARNPDINDAEERYEKTLKKSLNEYRKQTARQKYAGDESYKEFRQDLWAVHHSKEAMAPVRQFLPKEDADPESDDEDIEVGGVTQNYTCQITMTLFENAMTSYVPYPIHPIPSQTPPHKRICQHSFSRDALRDYFKTERSGCKKCPASGCSKELSMADFFMDQALQKKANEADRRRRHREMDEEEEEEEDVV